MNIPALMKSPLFENVSENELSAILKCLGAVEMKNEKDSYMMYAGNVTDNIGVIETGKALIIQEDVWGHRNIFSSLGPGDIMAAPYAASQGTPLSVSIVAETDCSWISISEPRILRTCSSSCGFHNRIIRNLVTILSRRLLSYNDKISHLSRRSTKEKVLSFLSSESQRQNSLSFDISFDRQQLADYLCVERAALSVVLSNLQKEGLIRYRKNHFELDPEAGLEDIL